jgi:hypothetical protein
LLARTSKNPPFPSIEVGRISGNEAEIGVLDLVVHYTAVKEG